VSFTLKSSVNPLFTRPAILFLLFLTLTAATRLPLAPESLYHFDSVNYALAVDHFDPVRHQPHPPGSPFFVLLLRFLRLFVLTPERALLLAGLLAAAASATLLASLGRSLFTPAAGIAAALLFLFHPALWFAGLTNQARTFLALASTGTALLALRASSPLAPVSNLYAAFAFAGMLGGFRAEAPVLLAPLLLWACWRRRPSVPHLFGAFAAAALPSLLWTGWTLHASGGLSAYLELLSAYSADQFSASSPLFGASLSQTWRMIEVALVFNLLATIAWLWACLRARPALRGHGLFLSLWFFPAFLFQCTVHVYDPDHALFTVPILCLLGGHTLAAAFSRPRPFAAALLAAAALSTALFLHPLRGAARPMSYQVVRRVDAAYREAFAAIRLHAARGPVTIFTGNSLLSWRHLAYYFPSAEIWAAGWNPDGLTSPTQDPSRIYIHLGPPIRVLPHPPEENSPAAPHTP
jgi:hypothetical protein